MKIFEYKKSLAGLIAAAALLFYSITIYYFPNTPFYGVAIKVEDDRENITFKLTEVESRSDITAVINVNGKVQRVKLIEGELNLHLSEYKKNRSIYEVTFVDKEDTIGTISFARESPEYLKIEYGFSHPSGYIVIEKNTFKLKRRENTYADMGYSFDMKFDDEAKDGLTTMMDEFDSGIVEALQSAQNDELSKSISITKFLWRLYNTTGPSDIIKSHMNTLQVLDAIKKKGGSVQCTGTRDLFIGIAEISGSGLEIRRVDAFRYWPKIENIVVNGHSVVEIKQGDDWFLFDPFVRVYFRDASGKLLSADDINDHLFSKTLPLIQAVHIPTEHPKRRDFEPASDPYDPNEWNYFTHFNFLKYLDAV